jgi:glycine betaine/choline ABC-type transport system substrate-binding protein
MGRIHLISHGRLSCLLAAAVLCGCVGGPRHKTLVVGSKESPAHMALGQIIARHLEKRLGVAVEHRPLTGSTKGIHEAVLMGQIDLYPEDIGTAQAAIFRFERNLDPAMLTERVRQQYSRIQLEFVAPLGFSDAFALAAREVAARRFSINTLSEAAAFEPGWALATFTEFLSRDDGLAALQTVYTLRWTGAPQTMDRKAAYRALLDQKVTLAAGNLTDGSLLSSDFRILKDDKNAFGPNDVGIVVRADRLLEFPALRGALEELSGKFNVETMRRFSAAIESGESSPAQLARQFVSSQK